MPETIIINCEWYRLDVLVVQVVRFSDFAVTVNANKILNKFQEL